MTFDANTFIKSASDEDLELQYKRLCRQNGICMVFMVFSVVAFLIAILTLILVPLLGVKWFVASICVSMTCSFFIAFSRLKVIPRHLDTLNAECNHRVIEKALPSVNVIVDGRLYKGSESEIMQRLGETGIIVEICRTQSNSWFALTYTASDGLTKPTSFCVNPISEADAKLKFQANPEEYARIFGAPTIA